MNEEEKTRKFTLTEDDGGDERTEDILSDSKLGRDVVRTAAEEPEVFIPKKEPEDPTERPTRRFIKTDGPQFVSVRAEKLIEETAAGIEKYSDRLISSAAQKNVHTGNTGKINTYDAIHTPDEIGRMINDSDYEEQLTLPGANAPGTAPQDASDEPSDTIPYDPTRHFDSKGSRLREIADTAGDDVRRNPDQMMMDGFEEIGKKTDEEIAFDEALKDELKQARQKRVMSFRFWDKAPEQSGGEVTDEKFEKHKNVQSLPAFAEKFAMRFAHIPTPFTPIASEEYTGGGNRKAVFTAIRSARTKALVSLFGLSAIGLILLITDVVAKLTASANDGFTSVFGGNVTALALFNLIFLVIAAGLMLPELKNGVVSVLKLRPQADALFLLLMLSALGQTVAALFTQLKVAGDFQLLAPAAVLAAVPYLLAKLFYYDNARHCFKTVSAKSEKAYLRRVTDKELSARLGCAGEADGNTVYIGRTRGIGGFPASGETTAASEMPRSRVTAILAGVSVLTALIVTIVKGSPACGLSALTLCLSLSIPVSLLAAAGFYLSRANEKLSLKSSYIQSYEDAKAFSSINNIACDASDLFHGEITNCMTAGGVSKKQAHFAAACAAAGTGSLMRKLFAPDIETYEDKLSPAKNTVYEDKMGISSYVSGCTVLLGNHDMMLNHNIPVPEESAVLSFLKEGERPLYLAMEGRFTAVFAVEYAAEDDIKAGVRALVNCGASLLLGTTDPNITDAFAEELLGIPENSVRLVNNAAMKKLEDAQNSVAETEQAGTVFSGSFVSVCRSAAVAVKLDGVKTLCKAISTAGAFVSLALGVILSLTGAFSSVSAFAVVLIHCVWLALCFGSPMFTETLAGAVKRLRSAPAAAPEAAYAPEETPEEEAEAPAERTQPEVPAEAPEEDEAEAEEAVPAEIPSEERAPAAEAPAAPDETDFEDITPAQTKEKEDDVLSALERFAPRTARTKDTAATAAPDEDGDEDEPREDARPRFISSDVLKKSFSSIGSYFSKLTEKEPVPEEEDLPDAEFSLYGEKPERHARKKPSADDIETEYDRRKREESELRNLFTAPEDPEAPVYDLRKKPTPPATPDPEPPLDTSDVNVYNDELFRRFEDDDVFAGLERDDEDGSIFDF